MGMSHHPPADGHRATCGQLLDQPNPPLSLSASLLDPLSFLKRQSPGQTGEEGSRRLCLSPEEDGQSLQGAGSHTVWASALFLTGTGNRF